MKTMKGMMKMVKLGKQRPPRDEDEERMSIASIEDQGRDRTEPFISMG